MIPGFDIRCGLWVLALRVTDLRPYRGPNRGHEPRRSMPTETTEIETLANREYKWGFVTDIESDSLPPGLSEDTVRFISAKKGEPEWMLEWRLKAYRHWLTMEEPHDWPKLHYPKIDYQASDRKSTRLNSSH